MRMSCRAWITPPGYSFHCRIDSNGEVYRSDRPPGSHRRQIGGTSFHLSNLDVDAKPSSSGCMTGSERIHAGWAVCGSSSDLAIAAPQKPAFVSIIEVVTLQDGREILPIRLHLAPPAAPTGDPQISGLERAQDDFPLVSAKPFFDQMRCHPHDPTSFQQEKIPGRANLLTPETRAAKRLHLCQRETDREGAKSRTECWR